MSYTHYKLLLPIKEDKKIDYYIDIAIKQNLSVSQLRERIKNNEYERLPEDTKNKLVTKEDSKIEDFIKNPIIIKKNSNSEKNFWKDITEINIGLYRIIYESIRKCFLIYW